VAMKRILYVTRVPITASRIILPLARRLRSMGVEVAFAFGPGEGLDEIAPEGFPYHIVEVSNRSASPANLLALRAMKNMMKAGGLDVVHTYSPVMGVYGRLAARRAGIPVIVHSVIGSMFGPGVPFANRCWYYATEMLLARHVDQFVTLNDADAKDLVDKGFARPDQVFSLTFEYGVDLGAFDPGLFDAEAVAETRASFGLRVGVPVVGYVGRMIGAKGVLELYDAFRLFRRRGADAQLLFLGDVLTTDADQGTIRVLRQRIAADGLADDVSFAGFRNDVPRCIMAMDVVVLPSYHEGFPRIPIEAGAMGKAAITTATTGADVAVVHGQTGLIVPIRDVGALEEALWQLITTAGLAARMGQAGRCRVVELFDREKIVERQLEAYPRAYARAGLRWD